MEVSESLGKKLTKLREREAARRLLAQIFATGFGLGYLPFVPGTWASIATGLVWYLVYRLTGEGALVIHILAVVFLFPLAWVASGTYARLIGRDDPSIVVIDEIFGQSLPFLFAPVSGVTVIIGCVLFRVFDIVKPPPVRQCERLPGGLGILMDDCAAGLCAGLLLWLIHAS